MKTFFTFQTEKRDWNSLQLWKKFLKLVLICVCELPMRSRLHLRKRPGSRKIWKPEKQNCRFFWKKVTHQFQLVKKYKTWKPKNLKTWKTLFLVEPAIADFLGKKVTHQFQLVKKFKAWKPKNLKTWKTTHYCRFFRKTVTHQKSISFNYFQSKV